MLRPGMFIGSLEKLLEKVWVFKGDAVAHRIITYVSGFHKIFDEFLINTANNKQCRPSMNALHVEINLPMCTVSIYNNGEGIPIVIHKVERVSVP